MWRTVASLGLTFGAMAWAIISTALCFFYASSVWIEWFGRFGAFYSAVFSFAVCFFGAKLLLRAADKVIEPYTGPFDAGAYSAAPPDTFYRDWRRYAADIVNNRRYAFYIRTRQFEKLRELEASIAASGASGALADAVSVPDRPRHTSMAHRATFDENRRAARRTSHKAPKMERWTALEDDELEAARVA